MPGSLWQSSTSIIVFLCENVHAQALHNRIKTPLILSGETLSIDKNLFDIHENETLNLFLEAYTLIIC